MFTPWLKSINKMSQISHIPEISIILVSFTNTGENVQKWTRVVSTRRWVILVARTRQKKR